MRRMAELPIRWVRRDPGRAVTVLALAAAGGWLVAALAIAIWV